MKRPQQVHHLLATMSAHRSHHWEMPAVRWSQIYLWKLCLQVTFVQGSTTARSSLPWRKDEHFWMEVKQVELTTSVKTRGSWLIFSSSLLTLPWELILPPWAVPDARHMTRMKPRRHWSIHMRTDLPLSWGLYQQPRSTAQTLWVWVLDHRFFGLGWTRWPHIYVG